MTELAYLLLILVVVAIAVFAYFYYWRRRPQGFAPVFGTSPAIPAPKPQGAVPVLKMPTAKGWAPGEMPKAAPGLRVAPFAQGLKHPRWAHVLPNGDVLLAESASEPWTPTRPMDYAMMMTMRRAGAMQESANRITLLRDADGDGVPEIREVFLEGGLRQPFGMALLGSTFYVGNTDSVMAFPYAEGATRISGPGRKLMDLRPGGHWTRNLLASRDGEKLYVAVGSVGNIGEGGMAAEAGRACIHELDLATGRSRIFAGGLRNPVGMAWDPAGQLWTVVNERDGLGDETPPDYLTSVRYGGFYGWPYRYWGIVDGRVPQDDVLSPRSLVPDYALGGHTASLGLCWLPEGVLPGYGPGMVIGQHGSWNRSVLSGYKVVFVPFVDGRPSGVPRDILTGFLAPDEKTSNGRPVGVAVTKDKALLVVDDTGNSVWRVTGA